MGNTEGMERLILILAALPEPEWRTLRASIEYGLNNAAYEPNDVVLAIFPDGLPDAKAWHTVLARAMTLRTDSQQAVLGDRRLTRQEYMRFYMQRRRAKQVQ